MRRLFLVLAFALFSATLLADNTITVSSASGVPGEEVTIDVSLNNSDAVVAAEIRIPLNRYIQYIAESAVLNPERSNGHQLSAASVNNELRLYVYGFGTNALKGNIGHLCSFRLKLGKSPEAWTMAPNVVLSDAQGERLTASAVNGRVTILVPQLTVETPNIDYGHVPIRNTYTRNVTLRNSGTSLLTVSNITFSVREFSVEESSFSIEAGGTKTVMVHYAPTKHGAVRETMTIASDASNGKQQATLVADPYSVNELHVGNASGVSDGEVTIPITMNNMEPIAGAQWSFILPDALRYVEGSIQTAEHSEGLSANATVVGNKLTCYLYTTSSAKIEEGDGVIANLKLRLQGASGTYYLSPSEVVLSNVGMENMVSATTYGWVSISSPRLSSASTLNMGSSPVTETANKTYTMYNAGSAPLVVSRVTFLAEGFSIAEEFPLTIESGVSKDITVSYQGTVEGNYSTTMQIYSNDPNARMKSVAVSGNLFEPNVLSLTSRQCSNGKDYSVTVALDNYSSIVAFQTDVVSTKPFTLDANEVLKTERLNGLSVLVSPVNETTWRVLLYSLNNTPISGNEGNLLTLTLHPKDEETDLLGATVSLNNILLSNTSGVNKNTSGLVSCELQMPPFVLGDVNRDGVINVTDVLAVISLIADGSSQEYERNAADINGDGEINVTDVLGLLELLTQ